MKRYILKRLLTGFLAVAFVFVFNFFIIRLAPGSPVRVLAGRDDPSQEMIDHLNAKYGLDKPIYVQLGAYLKNVLHGDFENSILYSAPVTKLIKETLGPSLLLTLTSITLGMLIGTGLGLRAAEKRGGIVDKLASGSSYILNAMPSFWLGLVFMMFFATRLRWLPSSGMKDLRQEYEGFELFIDIIKHMILPAGTLILINIPTYFKITKSSVIQVLSEDFIVTFRAAGMDEKKIFKKYVFKNAILPTITVFGISLAYVITGASLVETVFGWPGMGRLMLEGIMGRDYPLIMAIYLMLSIAITFMMIVVDLVYAYIDPRIRFH